MEPLEDLVTFKFGNENTLGLKAHQQLQLWARQGAEVTALKQRSFVLKDKMSLQRRNSEIYFILLCFQAYKIKICISFTSANLGFTVSWRHPNDAVNVCSTDLSLIKYLLLLETVFTCSFPFAVLKSSERIKTNPSRNLFLPFQI